MASCASCGSQAQSVVLRAVDVSLLRKVLQQEQQEGRAGNRLIEAAALPQPGAPEPGKGNLVDVVA